MLLLLKNLLFRKRKHDDTEDGPSSNSPHRAAKRRLKSLNSSNSFSFPSSQLEFKPELHSTSTSMSQLAELLEQVPDLSNPSFEKILTETTNNTFNMSTVILSDLPDATIITEDGKKAEEKSSVVGEAE